MLILKELQFKKNLPYAEQLFICRTSHLLIYLTIRWAQLGISIVLRHYSDEMLTHMMSPDEGNSGSDSLRVVVFLGFSIDPASRNESGSHPEWEILDWAVRTA